MEVQTKAKVYFNFQFYVEEHLTKEYREEFYRRNNIDRYAPGDFGSEESRKNVKLLYAEYYKYFHLAIYLSVIIYKYDHCPKMDSVRLLQLITYILFLINWSTILIVSDFYFLMESVPLMDGPSF